MLYNIHLQLFADGGGEAGGGSENAADNDFESKFASQYGFRPGTAAPEKAEPKPASAKTEAEGTEETKQSEQAKTPEDADAAFEALIKGEYKDAYGKRVQKAVNDRFKNHNAELAKAQQQLQDTLDAIDPYLKKLGVDANDLDAIRAAAMEDASNFRSRALEENISIPEAIQRYQEEREQQRSEAQMERLRQDTQKRALNAEHQKLAEGWKAEESEIQKTDPDFDLGEELDSNDAFKQLFNATHSVTAAYRATHYEANMAKIAGAVEQQTAINTAQRIAAGRQRPAEGGLSGSPATSSRTDYKNLPEKDIMAIFNESLKH